MNKMTITCDVSRIRRFRRSANPWKFFFLTQPVVALGLAPIGAISPATWLIGWVVLTLASFPLASGMQEGRAVRVKIFAIGLGLGTLSSLVASIISPLVLPWFFLVLLCDGLMLPSFIGFYRNADLASPETRPTLDAGERGGLVVGITPWVRRGRKRAAFLNKRAILMYPFLIGAGLVAILAFVQVIQPIIQLGQSGLRKEQERLAAESIIARAIEEYAKGEAIFKTVVDVPTAESASPAAVTVFEDLTRLMEEYGRTAAEVPDRVIAEPIGRMKVAAGGFSAELKRIAEIPEALEALKVEAPATAFRDSAMKILSDSPPKLGMAERVAKIASQLAVYLFFFVGLLGGATGLYRSGRRRAMLPGSKLIERDPRPTVLYLRSFGDDRIKMHARAANGRMITESLFRITFEEMATDHLWRYGPVRCIGRPGERARPLGAARDYAEGETWREQILQWMGQASLCVAVLGRSGGLRWELLQLAELGLLSKLIILAPPMKRKERASRWQCLEGIFGGDGRWPVPSASELARTRALVISPELGPVFITADRQDDWAYEAAIDAAVTLLATAGPMPDRSAEARPTPHQEERLPGAPHLIRDEAGEVVAEMI